MTVWPHRAEGRYNIDVALPELELAVELFGWQHEGDEHSRKYRERCDFIMSCGWKMLIVWYSSTVLDARILALVLLAGKSEFVGRELIAYSDGEMVPEAEYDFERGIILQRKRYGP